MIALESKVSTRLEMLEQRADLLEKIFLFVDIDVLNKAIALAMEDLGSACKAPSYLGASLMNAALGLVHRKLLGSHRATSPKSYSGASQPQKVQLPPQHDKVILQSNEASRGSISSSQRGPILDPVVEEEVESQQSLIAAAEEGKLNVVARLLHSKADPSVTNADLETALHRAAYRAQTEIVGLLLDARADPSARDKKGKTPMRKSYDDANVVAALLKARADPNAVDEAGRTTLHRSAENGHVDVIDVLVEAGADPNIGNIEKETPLHEAANFGQTDALQALIRAKGNVNTQDSYASTPLHFATYGGHVTIAQLLIASRADVLMPNDDDETPLKIATQCGKTDLAKLLCSCETTADSRTRSESSLGDILSSRE
jgi:ankyrin repeat protein